MFERRVDEDGRILLPRTGFWTMAGGAMGSDMYIFRWLRAVCERPEHRIGVCRIDILAHRNADLPAIGEERRGAVQTPPDFGAGCAVRVLHKEDLAQVRQRLVHSHPTNLFDS